MSKDESWTKLATHKPGTFIVRFPPGFNGSALYIDIVMPNKYVQECICPFEPGKDKTPAEEFLMRVRTYPHLRNYYSRTEQKIVPMEKEVAVLKIFPNHGSGDETPMTFYYDINGKLTPRNPSES
jgi:hypothetical protein